MPSTRDLSTIQLGFGRLHRQVATASANLYNEGAASATILAGLLAAMNQELAAVEITANTVSAGDVSYVILGTNVPFVGDIALEPLNNLFRVVDQQDQEIYDSVMGVPIQVASIVGAAIGSGFTTNNITLNFTGTIPVGVTYRIYYGVRKTLGDLRKDTFTYPAIRRSPQVEIQVEQLFRWLQDDPAGNPVWDQSWISTIGGLSRSGLDERYRRKSGAVTGNLDTPGDGAVITRDGRAPTSEATTADQDYANDFKDPFWAQWKSQIPGAISSYAFDGREDGGSGFVSLVSRRSIDTANDRTRPALSVAAFWTLLERMNNQSTLGGANTRTRIDPANTTNTKLNPDAGVTDADRSTIELGTGDFFYNVGLKSEVATGVDVLKITYPGGKPDEVYVITEIDPGGLGNNKRCILRTPAGGLPNFPSGVTTTGVSFQLLKTLFNQGGGAGTWQANLGSTQSVLLDQFMVAQPPPVTDSPALEAIDYPPVFFAAGRSETEAGNAQGFTALGWGGYNPDLWRYEPLGALRGDGSIQTTGRSIFGLYTTTRQTMAVTVTGSQQWDIDIKPRLEITVVVNALTLTLTVPGAWVPESGDRIEVLVFLAAGVNTFTLVWPSGGNVEFVFSSTGDKQPTQSPSSETWYSGIYVDLLTNPAFRMSKVSYPSGGILGP